MCVQVYLGWHNEINNIMSLCGDMCYFRMNAAHESKSSIKINFQLSPKPQTHETSICVTSLV